MKIAIAFIIKNEVKRIPQMFKDLEGHGADKIWIYDDESVDSCIEAIQQSSHEQVNIELMLPTLENFDEKRNYVMEQLYQEGYTHVLFIDADERFDPYFLEHIQEIIQNNLEYYAYAFPRINLSTGLYPDYQVRLLKLQAPIQWMHQVHEQVYLKEQLVPPTPILDTGKCMLLKQYPILHYLRNNENTRPWW